MKFTIDKALVEGIAAHKDGRLQDAEKFYTAILNAEPKHANTNHNMGVLFVNCGKIDKALIYFKTAIETNPTIAQFWLSYIDACIQLNKTQQAKLIYEKAIHKGFTGKGFDNLGEKLNMRTKQSSFSTKPINPTQSQFAYLINLYKDGQLELALEKSNELLHLFPNSITLHNLLGSIKSNFGKFDEAIGHFKKTLEINSKYAAGFYNIALTLQTKGDSAKAIIACKQAIEIKPDFAEAHNNLGNLYYESGSQALATASYKRAIKVKPDFSAAYYNLGTQQQERGLFEKALKNYHQALKHNPNYTEVKSNIVMLLTNYEPSKDYIHPIKNADEKIRHLNFRKKNQRKLSDNSAAKIISEASEIVNSYDLNINVSYSQIFRQNMIDLNCKRHMDIFKESQIIPRFCFNCYKVQIKPRSVIELIKLFAILDNLKLRKNNARKCMIELRSEVSGFYKSFIYCSSIKQANVISERVKSIIGQKIGLGIPVEVKRGCSEYALTFPEYKEINYSGPQLMSYNETWKSIEETYDAKHKNKKNSIPFPIRPGLSLNDILIIRNWLDYARGLGDRSADLIKTKSVFSEKYYNVAKARAKKYSFHNLY